jgi:hypothetical protein
MIKSELFDSSSVRSRIAEIRSKLRADSIQGMNRRLYSPTEYEDDVTEILRALFPYGVLPGIRLFSPTVARGEYGYEIDNMLHFRTSEVDILLLVESKKQEVKVDNSRWHVFYDNKPHNVLDQIEMHIQTVWNYLKPITENRRIVFHAIVVSSYEGSKIAKSTGPLNAQIHLTPYESLPAVIRERVLSDLDDAEYFRVSQSVCLDILRLSLPVRELGHPELSGSVRYISRCRRTLDDALFEEHFSPTKDRWVINGSAGMGKSVLLAYTIAVFCSGYELRRGAADTENAVLAKELFTEKGFDPNKGPIVVMAHSQKQLENLQFWFRHFTDRINEIERKPDPDIYFRQPQFMLCRGPGSFEKGSRWSALFLDEAHDLSIEEQKTLAEKYERDAMYLCLACDRHQKLKYGDQNAKIVEGLNFQNKSVRLSRIYRNPTPIYLASLGIMFRWFANEGPKIYPTVRNDMKDQFGIDDLVHPREYFLTLKNDAHPGNSWSHTVQDFPSPQAAYEFLNQEKLSAKDVLWVRFSKEDPYFDYELLNSFTYHNLRHKDSVDLCNKYIKGQDFPIVVIEGFPKIMDRHLAGVGQAVGTEERKMWAFRREIYLCASRATSFLYFVTNGSPSEENSRIKAEITQLIAALSVPKNPESNGTKEWSFQISKTDLMRPPNIFDDLMIRINADAVNEESRLVEAAVPKLNKLDLISSDKNTFSQNNHENIQSEKRIENHISEKETELEKTRHNAGIDDTRPTVLRDFSKLSITDKEKPLIKKDKKNKKAVEPYATTVARIISKELSPDFTNMTSISLSDPVSLEDIARVTGLKPFRANYGLMGVTKYDGKTSRRVPPEYVNLFFAALNKRVAWNASSN